MHEYLLFIYKITTSNWYIALNAYDIYKSDVPNVMYLPLPHGYEHQCWSVRANVLLQI